MNEVSNRKEVDVFIPCSVDQFSPEIGFDLIGLVESMGFRTNYNPEQTCCGRVMFDNGNWDEAKKLGEKFIDNFNNDNYIVTCSTSCVGYLKTKCADLFLNTSYHNAYKSLAKRIMDVTEFIHTFKPNCELGSEFNHKVYLHNNCHAQNEYNVEEETRLILSKVKGLQLVNEKDECLNFCCGYGAGMNLYNPPVSEELARQKIELAINLGAEYITSADNSCLLHLQNYITKHNLDIKTIHLVSLLRYSSKQNNNE